MATATQPCPTRVLTAKDAVWGWGCPHTPHPGALVHTGGPQGWSSATPMDRSSPCALHEPQITLPLMGLSFEHQPVFCFALLVFGIFRNSHYLIGVMRKLINIEETPLELVGEIL